MVWLRWRLALLADRIWFQPIDKQANRMWGER